MKHIPIFFASDDNYAAPLSVSIGSIKRGAQDKYIYDIRVLTSDMNCENRDKLTRMSENNINVTVVDITDALIANRPNFSNLRDYYSESIYYRLFIPELYPEIKKAVYIDCDTVVLTDIAELYFTELGENLLAAVADECIPDIDEFSRYVERWVGVPREKYFNSGVLVMNLEALRHEGIPELIFDSIEKYGFDTVAPDQDYLNYFCRGRVYYLPSLWNKQPNHENYIPPIHLSLIHFNMFNKPWHYKGVLYEDEFWKFAESSEYLEQLRSDIDSYTDKEREDDINATVKLISTAGELADKKGGFAEFLGGAVTVG